MGFPSKWMKMYTLLPGSVQYSPTGPPYTKVVGTFSQWFSYDIEPPLDSLSLTAINNNLQLWMWNWASIMCYGSTTGGAIHPWFYLNTASHGIKYWDNYTPYLHWTITPTLPMVKSIVMQTFSGPANRRSRGRKYLGCVDLNAIDGDRLHPVQRALYQTAVDTFLTPFTAVGTTFTPGSASYADDAFYPYTSLRIVTRLGNLKRRGRNNRTGWNTGVPPVPPP